MEICAVKQAVEEAKRFIARAEAFLADPPEYQGSGSMKSGALRRSSMDLTRALADMRQNRKGGA